MTSAQSASRTIEVLIRRDGVGEIRDSGDVERVVAADADALRGEILTRMVALAEREGSSVELRTIDIDGIFPLRVSPDGRLEETGDVVPLAPGDDDLTERFPDAVAETPEDGGFLPQGDVHETVRIPRTEMMHEDLDGAHIPGADAEPVAEAPSDPEGPWFEDRVDEDGLEDTQPWQPRFPRGDRRAAAPESEEVETGPRPILPPRGAPLAARDSGTDVPRPQRRATDASAPTLADLLADKQVAPEAPAQRGWRSALRIGTGGLIKLGPGEAERQTRDEIRAIQRQFDGARTVVVMNPKGGAHKTTATLMIAATFGQVRGGYSLAWDNNETRGTLGWRSHPGTHRNTAVDFLRQLPRFEISGGATIADVDQFVRAQGDAQFDVLASDDDAASAAIIDAEAFSRMHRTLSRFYRVLVVDTGNNMRASNWEAALDVADQLVIVSTAREDTAASAAWLADGLRERGYGDKLADAVTILSSPSAKEDPALTERLRSHFERLTRAVVEVPYDQAFVGGGELSISSLQPSTRDAWRTATAAIAARL